MLVKYELERTIQEINNIKENKMVNEVFIGQRDCY